MIFTSSVQPLSPARGTALLRHAHWLKGFTRKIEVSWWMIVLPGVIVVVARC
jgi:hypothetical protein